MLALSIAIYVGLPANPLHCKNLMLKYTGAVLENIMNPKLCAMAPRSQRHNKH